MALRVIVPELAELPDHWRELLAEEPAEVRERQVERLRTWISDGDLEPSEILLAVDDNRVCGGMLFHVQPGAQAVVFPPRANSKDAADQLVLETLSRLKLARVKLAQTFLRTDSPLPEALTRHGFRKLTQLIFLERPIQDTDRISLDATLDFLPYSRGTLGDFSNLLQATYTGTRDCPELNGVRSIGEVMDGYFLSPDAAKHWWIAKLAGTSAGIVMLAQKPSPGDWELTYLGLVPEFRGRKLGGELLRFAHAQAARHGGTAIQLCTDSRNEPARKLYRETGYEPFDSQTVLYWCPEFEMVNPC